MNRETKNKVIFSGKNQEDLKAISAYIQDSIVTVRDIVFLSKNRIFIMIVNRFMWEEFEKKKHMMHKRIRCAIKFEGVIKVKSKKINQENKNKSLEILDIKCNEILNKNYEIIFLFSGNAVITLIAEAIEVVLNDLGEAWNVKHIPQHKI